ncbi:hypothetical protein EYF80_031563 [Liparis tanakae]|uniref:Uncharacterized protein n=1 Tax=Liparis tanakae TaxID=230148 RepID=A0A4Z2GZK0_9TELE|nr:hypothetical protein EYF80_031563 [Liparis tanakae]
MGGRMGIGPALDSVRLTPGLVDGVRRMVAVPGVPAPPPPATGVLQGVSVAFLLLHTQSSGQHHGQVTGGRRHLLSVLGMEGENEEG